MEEQDVNNFSQSVIPEFGTSISAAIMPGIWEGVNKIAQGQANKAELERKKKQELASITEELDPEIVWEVDQGELLKFAKDKGGELTTEAMEKKYNMDELNYGKFAEKVKSTKKELSIKTKKAQENKAAFDKVQEEYKKQTGLGDDADFDLEHMDAWINKFKNAGSIEERNAMLRDTEYTPYKRNYALLDMALAMLPKPKSVTDASGATRVFVDEEAYANRIFEYVSSQDGEGYYEKFKNSGESPEAFAERMANKFINDDRIVSENFRASSPAKSGSGGGSTKKVGFVPNTDKATDPNIYSQSKAQNILYIKTPQGKPPASKAGVVRTAKDSKGQPIVDPVTGEQKNITEQIIVNSAFYNTKNELMVSIVRFKPGGEQTGIDEVVPYKDHKQDYDNYAGFDIQAKLDKANDDEEAKLKGKSTTTKSTTKSTDSKPKNAAEALRKSNAEKKK